MTLRSLLLASVWRSMKASTLQISVTMRTRNAVASAVRTLRSRLRRRLLIMKRVYSQYAVANRRMSATTTAPIGLSGLARKSVSHFFGSFMALHSQVHRPRRFADVIGRLHRVGLALGGRTAHHFVHEAALFQVQRALGALGGVRVVGDHEDGLVQVVLERGHQVEDFAA